MNPLITGEMVDVAAEAAYTQAAWDAQNFTGTNWTELDPVHRAPWLREAESALEAAVPLIAAKALLDAADSWRAIQRTDDHLLRQWLAARAERFERGES